MTISAHAAEIQQGDYIAWIDNGERKRIEAVAVIRDCGCIHVRTWGPRVVTFPNTYAVDIQR